MKQYWMLLIILILVYTLLLVIKYFLLNISIFRSSTDAHEAMIKALVRSPSNFFDTTPSGIIINKFSYDLGVIDSSLAIILIDVLEGPTLIFVAIANLLEINLWLIIPIFIAFLVALLFFKYSRSVIIKYKQMDLQNKNPVSQFYIESLNGLIQIKICKQKIQKIQRFS